MKAPIGATVGLYVDTVARMKPGDCIKTGTGRTYLVLDVRVQARGKRKGRQHLRCLVGDGTENVEGETYEITWYRRKKKAHGQQS